MPYFFALPKQTGAVCSSSKYLAAMIIKNIGIEQASNIIEIGPGMGAFTKAILQKKSKSAHLLAVEINPKIAEKLRKRFPNLDIALGSAESLQAMIQERRMSSIDVIVCGIPWALLSQATQKCILENIYNVLSPGGYFATFAYILPTTGAKRFRERIYGDKMFSEIKKSKIVWNNFPPAFVYYCRK